MTNGFQSILVPDTSDIFRGIPEHVVNESDIEDPNSSYNRLKANITQSLIHSCLIVNCIPLSTRISFYPRPSREWRLLLNSTSSTSSFTIQKDQLPSGFNTELHTVVSEATKFFRVDLITWLSAGSQRDEFPVIEFLELPERTLICYSFNLRFIFQNHFIFRNEEKRKQNLLTWFLTNALKYIIQKNSERTFSKNL